MSLVNRIVLVTLVGLASVWLAFTPAQSADTTKTAKPNTPPPGWSTRCAGAERAKDLDCAIEQRAVITETGQLLVGFTIRIPPDTHKPVLMLQVPVGLFLPAGVKISVDNAAIDQLQLQTCDLSGCYAGSEVSEKLLEAMKTGKTLNIGMQSIAKKDINVPIPLSGFKEAYSKIE